MSAPSTPGLYDLFVSYSTKDNIAPDGEREGWVPVFIQRVRHCSPFHAQLFTP